MDFQVRDPVHGFIQLRKKEADLVATPVMQRLRGVKQLAMASLVYPGALHTRFDHSVGVFHVASHMAQALELDTHCIEIIRFAALLHDIGHGPFSHVSENALERYADRSALDDEQKKEKIHELITMRLLRTDLALQAILGQNDCNAVADLLGPEGYGEPVNRNVVSGPLDADKQDYLLRDSLFCGVSYGVFDLRQMWRSLTVHGAQNERQLMIKEDGIHAVEQYVLAKYYLTSNVYRHKVRLITDQMITRAIVLGIERDGIESMRQLYSFDGTDDFVQRYVAWDDARFMEEFCPATEQRDGKCWELLDRLRKRHLLKRVFRAKPREFGVIVREGLGDLSLPENERKRRRIESGVAELLSQQLEFEVDPDFVIAHSFGIKSVRTQARNDEAGILVCTIEGPRSFEDESALFKSINEGEKEEYFEIYAPVSWGDRTQRDRIVLGLRESFMNLITEVLSGENGEVT